MTWCRGLRFGHESSGCTSLPLASGSRRQADTVIATCERAPRDHLSRTSAREDPTPPRFASSAEQLPLEMLWTGFCSWPDMQAQKRPGVPTSLRPLLQDVRCLAVLDSNSSSRLLGRLQDILLVAFGCGESYTHGTSENSKCLRLQSSSMLLPPLGHRFPSRLRTWLFFRAKARTDQALDAVCGRG